MKSLENGYGPFLAIMPAYIGGSLVTKLENPYGVVAAIALNLLSMMIVRRLLRRQRAAIS